MSPFFRLKRLISAILSKSESHKHRFCLGQCGPSFQNFGIWSIVGLLCFKLLVLNVDLVIQRCRLKSDFVTTIVMASSSIEAHNRAMALHQCYFPGCSSVVPSHMIVPVRVPGVWHPRCSSIACPHISCPDHLWDGRCCDHAHESHLPNVVDTLHENAAKLDARVKDGQRVLLRRRAVANSLSWALSENNDGHASEPESSGP